MCSKCHISSYLILWQVVSDHKIIFIISEKRKVASGTVSSVGSSFPSSSVLLRCADVMERGTWKWGKEVKRVEEGEDRIDRMGYGIS